MRCGSQRQMKSGKNKYEDDLFVIYDRLLVSILHLFTSLVIFLRKTHVHHAQTWQARDGRVPTSLFIKKYLSYDL